ncbi:MAG: NHL repeat-containing protein [Bacteroidota bacterium]|nr:NHL repeat-containing protein [Bacteroidota bacterium]
MSPRALGFLCAIALVGTPRLHAQDGAVFAEDFRFGSFTRAVRIEADPFGCVYVSDAGAHTVVKYSPDGTMLATAGGQGWGIMQFDHPAGIDARLGITVYVADRGNNRIVRLDRSLAPIGTFSTRDDPSAGLSFGDPLDVVITKRGDLLILDGENVRIVATTGFTAAEKAFGGIEAGPLRLRKPVAMARSEDDRIFVLEPDRVLVFDVFGNPLFSFAYKVFEDARGIACRDDRIAVVTPTELFLFTTEGELLQRVARERFVFAGTTGTFEDVALTGTRLYLLTAQSVLVFPRIPSLNSSEDLWHTD